MVSLLDVASGFGTGFQAANQTRLANDVEQKKLALEEGKMRQASEKANVDNVNASLRQGISLVNNELLRLQAQESFTPTELEAARYKREILGDVLMGMADTAVGSGADIQPLIGVLKSWDASLKGLQSPQQAGTESGERGKAERQANPIPQSPAAKLAQDVKNNLITPGEAGYAQAATEAATRFSSESTIRDDFNGLPAVKDLVAIRDAYGTMLNAVENPSAAGDIVLTFTFMKVNDPTSTVREGEQATVQNAGGIPVRLKNLYNKLIATGEALPPEVRLDLITQARSLYDRRVKTHRQVTEPIYRDIATRAGLDPKVIPDLVPDDLFPPIPKTPGFPPIPKTPGGGGEGEVEPLSLDNLETFSYRRLLDLDLMTLDPALIPGVTERLRRGN